MDGIPCYNPSKRNDLHVLQKHIRICALQAFPGVQRASVALATEEAEIHYDSRIAAASQLIVTPGFKEQSQVHLIHAPRRQHI
jgi:predicted metal-dependent RNase